jgi:hypothetical protein
MLIPWRKIDMADCRALAMNGHVAPQTSQSVKLYGQDWNEVFGHVLHNDYRHRRCPFKPPQK